MDRWNVGILIFDGVAVLDFAGPFEVLSRARLEPGVESRRSDEQALFDVFTVARTAEPVTATGGLVIVPRHSFADAPRIDLLLVPGGFGTRPLLQDAETVDWIRATAAKARVTASVCTGALLLARAGLLDGRRATTHWGSFGLLASLGKDITIDHDARVRGRRRPHLRRRRVRHGPRAARRRDRVRARGRRRDGPLHRVQERLSPDAGQRGRAGPAGRRGGAEPAGRTSRGRPRPAGPRRRPRLTREPGKRATSGSPGTRDRTRRPPRRAGWRSTTTTCSCGSSRWARRRTRTTGCSRWSRAAATSSSARRPRSGCASARASSRSRTTGTWARSSSAT